MCSFTFLTAKPMKSLAPLLFRPSIASTIQSTKEAGSFSFSNSYLHIFKISNLSVFELQILFRNFLLICYSDFLALLHDSWDNSYNFQGRNTYVLQPLISILFLSFVVHHNTQNVQTVSLHASIYDFMKLSKLRRDSSVLFC